MDTTLSDPLVGRLLDGRYQVEARIARGGMATVYTALDTRLDRTVALKVMHPALVEDGDFLARFSREAKAAARLSHPNLVSVYDQGRDGDHVFLVMEYVAGRTLRDLLRQRGRLSGPQALSVLEPVLAALQALHESGLVHRDVKPENVLLADDGRVKVADFGLARAIEAPAVTATTSLLIGTVAYLAPEQVERGEADARSDVYAAGIVLFELLTGEPPYDGGTALSVAYRHVHEDVPAPSSLAPDVPAALDQLVVRATRRDPAQRHADAAELLTAMAAARRSLGPKAADETAATSPVGTQTQVMSRPVPPPPPATAAPASPRKSRKGRIALAVVLVLALLSGVAGWWLAVGRYTDSPRVIGLAPAAATAKLKDAGLDVRQADPVYSDTVAKGLVADQDPGPGDRVRDGGTVTIHPSRGPEIHAVPVVRNKTLDEARTALGDLKLGVGQVTTAYDDRIPKDRVISSTPAAGTELRRDSEVDLVLSKGPAPVDMPRLVGSTRSEAEATLRRLGLEGKATETFDEQAPEGEVIAQRPETGAALHRGDTVEYTVSKGPELFEVPDVRGKREQDAREALTKAGFTVGDVNRFPDGPGRVVSQRPGGGTMQPRGTPINLYIF